MTSDKKVSVLIAERDERICVLESTIMSLCEVIGRRDSMSLEEIEEKTSAAMEAYGRNPSCFRVQPDQVIGGLPTDEETYSEMTKTRSGVAKMQRILSNARNRERILDEIVDECDAGVLARETHGRHALTMLCSFATQRQCCKIVSVLARDIVSIARDPRGGITLQVLCESTDFESNLILCSAISDHVRDLCRDQAGSYVVRSVVRKHAGSPSSLPPQSRIYEYVSECVCEISHAQVGCTLVNECIDCSDDAWRASISAAIIPHLGELAVDRYGNYVVQHMFGALQCGRELISALAAKAPDLCFSKYGSNVIEAALRCCPAAFPSVASAIIRDRSFYRMIDDKYGNFVVQKIATLCDNATRYEIERKIAAHVHRRGETHYAAYVKHNLSIKC